MKKIMSILLLILLPILSSCVIEDNDNDLLKKLQGKWQINKEVRLAIFYEDSYEIVELFNIPIDNGEITKINNNEIFWKSRVNGKSGIIKYIKHTPDLSNRESMIITNIPQSENKTDTIHKIF